MADPQKQNQHLVAEAIRLLSDEYESNERFNEYFDGDEHIEIGTLRYPRSKVLFWVDREAYIAERASWENESVEEEHREAKSLLQTPGINGVFQDLVDAVRRHRVVPFVGAGLSKHMDLPTWREALDELRERLLPKDEDLKTQLAAALYLPAAEALVKEDSPAVNAYIRSRFKVSILKGPVALLPKLASGCVVTTNFDAAIEEAYKLFDLQFEGYMHGTQSHNFMGRLARGDRCILKLHGDASDDPSSFVFTKKQYDKAYGKSFNFKKPLAKALRQIYISNTLLFLGCSLEQDMTLELFKHVKNQGDYEVPIHFAILPQHEDAQEKQKKESRLLALNIYPIWYPEGHHDCVEKLVKLVIDVAEKRTTVSA
jgi:hypothetical protein